MDEIIAKVDNFALITVRLKEVDRPNFEQKRAVYIACYSVDKEVDGQQHVDECEIFALL